MSITDELLNHLDQVLPATKAKSRLCIGYSGGLDSSVLLFLARKVRPEAEITAIHCNHALSAEANEWQLFCEARADALGVDFFSETLSFPEGFSEAKGREARYQVFKKYIGQGDTLLLGHHADDQAETILFRLFRGTGTKGLAAMAPERAFFGGQILRPLLEFSKKQLTQFAIQQKIQWIEDRTNADNVFDRNYIRNQMMPLILHRWPKAMDSLKDLAAIMREDRALLANYADKLLRQVDFVHDSRQGSLDLSALDQLPKIEIRLVFRRFIESVAGQSINSALLQELEQQFLYSSKDSEPCIRLAKHELHRFGTRLFLISKLPDVPMDFEVNWDGGKPLQIASLGQLELVEGASGNFLVRFRQGGERAQPLGRAHSQTLKKLFQEYRIEPWLRHLMPLIFLDDRLISVGGRIRCSEHQFRITVAGDNSVKL